MPAERTLKWCCCRIAAERTPFRIKHALVLDLQYQCNTMIMTFKEKRFKLFLNVCKKSNSLCIRLPGASIVLLASPENTRLNTENIVTYNALNHQTITLIFILWVLHRNHLINMYPTRSPPSFLRYIRWNIKLSPPNTRTEEESSAYIGLFFFPAVISHYVM